jgi:hypothetical protein
MRTRKEVDGAHILSRAREDSAHAFEIIASTHPSSDTPGQRRLRPHLLPGVLHTQPIAQFPPDLPDEKAAVGLLSNMFSTPSLYFVIVDKNLLTLSAPDNNEDR